ncbi:hypothetical protein D3C73_585080 [compost metagenome]
MQNHVAFDPVSMQLSYSSSSEGKLWMDRSQRTINGERVTFPYPTYNGPYMYSAFNSGVIEVRSNGTKATYDFNQITVRQEKQEV